MNRDEAIKAYTRRHVTFLRIHPFWDGNGRIARLIVNVPVIRAGYPPIIIQKEHRREYIDALSEYHLSVGTVAGRGGLLPEIDNLHRFKRFCVESWSATTMLVNHARRKQAERNQEILKVVDAYNE